MKKKVLCILLSTIVFAVVIIIARTFIPHPISDSGIEEIVYKDGGSQVYKYPDYTIVKYHTLDGNDDMYIGTPDIDIHVKDK